MAHNRNNTEDCRNCLPRPYGSVRPRSPGLPMLEPLSSEAQYLTVAHWQDSQIVCKSDNGSCLGTAKKISPAKSRREDSA